MRRPTPGEFWTLTVVIHSGSAQDEYSVAEVRVYSQQINGVESKGILSSVMRDKIILVREEAKPTDTFIVQVYIPTKLICDM